MLKALVSSLCLLALVACTAPVKKDHADTPQAKPLPQVQTGRYSTATVGATAAQVDPLNAIIRTYIPRDIESVGDAMVHVLRLTGYRLASPEASDPNVRTLYHLPLPQVQRELGPITVREALTVLAGSPYVLVVDPIHRLVSFDVKEPYASKARSGH